MKLILPEEDAALRKKWFGTPLDIGTYGRYIGWGLTAAAGAALLLALLIMALRRQVALKTQTLNAALAKLREAHAATSEAEHSLAATLQAIPDMLFEFDASGHYMNVFSSGTISSSPPAASSSASTSRRSCRRRQHGSSATPYRPQPPRGRTTGAPCASPWGTVPSTGSN